ncbi:hypothetical protein QJS10_CPB18g00238 [Acorus calamus]|uniref:TsaA-like domain-containing protein n=1 Tax=Acorus calamus TaxID=4465 RepID=A0AAV9CKD2_ACOCL|nr:hypothetical protein QJS10_CPB18g00238 [Acorus calamus]
MATSEATKWPKFAVSVLAALSSSLLLSFIISRRKTKGLIERVRELEASLEASVKNCSAERRGRIRAQQALRKALPQNGTEETKGNSYPMVPIGTVRSCFSTRNGTPRQPVLAPLARACLVLDVSRIPAEAVEGLAEYSHCWILYIFHLNTDLDKLWSQPSRSKFKAKVRVPILQGSKMGVLATRSPHRPCPIGLTVAKVEAVDGHAILLSGVDLVDGTPVLDIKPYLPYSDSIQEATIPKWVVDDHSLVVSSVNFSPDFASSLANCWVEAEKYSLYASPMEFQSLIRQVLLWDIRSLSQRTRPHQAIMENLTNGYTNSNNKSASNNDPDTEIDDGISSGSSSQKASLPRPGDITYHLLLEGIDISYRIDGDSNVVVEKAMLTSSVKNDSRSRSNYMWKK